ncbi:OstA-like protein [Tamlana sp. 2_MG-2023]|uniref:OstA-like protein n=1 Tax=unclassified Tamlana TaxID=2614803 RepID=UPI0026E3E7CC|nr:MULTISPECIES: OstA-like protein [unclassified Tamlana]MDO6758897.1 OstA-like protein [Tamlana sp. 2_MG-2023]MDO6789596.1 OstA-like protein [Tamlana sp. 1_MG-2023]
MNKLQVLLLIFVIGFVSVNGAQEKRKIQIEYAGKLTIDEENYPGAKVLTRDDKQQVHIIHGGSNMWCDKAIHYGEENFVEAYGNVSVKQGDTINMTSKYVEYSGITELAFASGDVVLTDPHSTISSDTLYFDRVKQQAFYRNGGKVVKDSSGTITSKIGRYYMDIKKYQFVNDVVLVNKESTINSDFFDFYSDSGFAYLFGPSTITTETSKTYCEKGFYDTKLEVGYALKNAKIDYDNRIVEGDSLFFDNNKSFASATNNIKVTDTLNNSIIKGHYAEVFKEKDSLFITKRALAITVQEKDSVFMHADKIMVTGKPDNRIINAYYNAKIFKSDITGKSDSIHANQKTGLTKLINIPRLSAGDKFSTARKPILWNFENQMTGDTIHLISNSKTEKIDSLLVFNHSFIISKDTLSDNGYNQIYGLRLVGLFNDENALREVNIIKNAESIFYARNEKQELIGIDKAKSGSIKILFAEGDIEEYSRFNQVDGDLIPESKYPKKDKFLKGFDWREDERPTSVEDLFSDDPPLELPVIKGLDDYIPSGEFFDEAMQERIKLAGKGEPHKNKAARNIPKKTENLLEFPNEFSHSKWLKNGINADISPMKTPNNDVSDLIKGTGTGDGHIFQIINKTYGTFKFSVWMKGKGKTRLRLQRADTNYAVYATLPITVTNEWKEYTLIGHKSNDGSKLRCLISDLQTDDSIYVWGAKLIEVLEE